MIEREIDYLIVGSGPTGLSAGQIFKKNGSSFLILEKENHSGGLAYYFGTKYHYDLGAHVFFTKDEKVINFLKEIGSFSDLKTYQRKAYFKYRDKFIRFPIQYYLKDFPIDVSLRVLFNFVFKKESSIESFEDYLNSTLGSYFYKEVFYPYLKKVWAVEPSTLGTHWFNGRVAKISFYEILKSFFTDYNWGPNYFFYYPKRRFYDLFESLSANLPIKYNSRLVNIDPYGKLAFVVSGSDIIRYRYKYLISTIPLVELLDILKIKYDVDKFIHNSIYVVGLTFKGEIKKDFSWLYFSDSTDFFRTMNLGISEDADGYKKVLLERSYISIPPKVEVYKDLDSIFDIKEIVNFSDIKINYGYPIPVKGLDKILDPILKDLLKNNIISCGRFGAWKYEAGNTDHSIKQGINAALYCLNHDINIWRI